MAESSILLVRYRRGLVGESKRVVHIVPVPDSTDITRLTAYCGQLFNPGEAELVGEQGMPCVTCLATAPVPGMGQLDSGEPPRKPSTTNSDLSGQQHGPVANAVPRRGWHIRHHENLIDVGELCAFSCVHDVGRHLGGNTAHIADRLCWRGIQVH
jgi:hypothetical protein